MQLSSQKRLLSLSHISELPYSHGF
ncbi:nucleoside triphosphatase NudI, partial [Escherichia coli]|nr:nucleoside triphosphatase NudI [Escherichia coli]EFY0790515.1 nucleoside triphosphatase NudI [Shigella sonnei]